MPAAQLGLDRRGHLAIQRRQNLCVPLHDRGGNSAGDQVLGQFQPDEACPQDHRPADAIVRGPTVQSLPDAIGVLQVSQREHAGKIDAGHGRNQRRGPRGQDQLVV